MKLANLFRSDGLQTFCDMTAASPNSETNKRQPLLSNDAVNMFPRKLINTQQTASRESESKLNDFQSRETVKYGHEFHETGNQE
jgi:hypothetical protein